MENKEFKRMHSLKKKQGVHFVKSDKIHSFILVSSL